MLLIKNLSILYVLFFIFYKSPIKLGYYYWNIGNINRTPILIIIIINSLLIKQTQNIFTIQTKDTYSIIIICDDHPPNQTKTLTFILSSFFGVERLRLNITIKFQYNIKFTIHLVGIYIYVLRIDVGTWDQIVQKLYMVIETLLGGAVGTII